MVVDVECANGTNDKKYIQLTKLPNLQEVSMENPMEKLLAKSILLQLRSMSKHATISELAFEDLCQFVSLQLDDMLQCFKKITHIQRRNNISKIDLELFLKGTALTTRDLYEQVEISKYIHEKFPIDSAHLNDKVAEVEKHYMKELDESELLSSQHSEFFVQDVDILNLLPSTNKCHNYVPSWLPEFPPDHTYRFTALYKKTITDARIMKQKLFEEGKKSEQALINMLDEVKSDEQLEKDEQLTEQLKDAKAETELLFMKAEKGQVYSSDDVFKSLPLKGFDVEKYCINRVCIKRRREEEQEKRIENRKRNPFIKTASLCSPYAAGGAKSRKTIENQLKLLLTRSYLELVDSIPKTKAQRKEVKRQAEAREKELEERRRIEKENRMAQQELLDLNNLEHDSLFHGLENDSEEDEDENQEQEQEENGDGVQDADEKRDDEDNLLKEKEHKVPTPTDLASVSESFTTNNDSTPSSPNTSKGFTPLSSLSNQTPLASSTHEALSEN